MSVEKRVAAYLELATKDAEAAELLVAGGNRFAAYHMQQAVEKLTKAALLAKGIEAGIEHRLEELFKRFAEGDPWRERRARSSGGRGARPAGASSRRVPGARRASETSRR